ncbi:DUF7617 domain-containing protein [Solihabitans fulvus]|uniref:DUF7617 domain-containing protein n=1 Tax=Solihabitans fulvus TaxID=1892852 RepID=UPI001CB765DD|nr:hypothetical protein [Solihabitans fulvus]
MTTGISAVIPATAAPSSVLTKSAQDVTSPGANPANHGDTVNWSIGYTDNGSATPAPATITDPISAAATAQTYMPGSLHAPPGWTPSWSTDGSTFQSTDPGTATTAVRASNPSARPGGTSISNPLLAPVQATATATGGDGYTPILHRTASGAVESWNFYHHNAASQPKAVCVDLLTGALCAGGPWPKPLNTAPGPLGSGATGDIATPLTPQYVQDPARPDVVYYAAVTVASVGVGCIDLAARANCGYFPLQNTGGSPVVSGLAGLVALGGNMYGVSTNGQVLCLSIASQTPCAGQPYAAIVPPNNTGGLYLGSMTLAGGKIFASSSPQGSAQPMLGCFDPATNTVCVGWASPHAVGAAGYFAYGAYTAYDTSGAEIGACVSVVNTPLTTCYTIAGAPLAAPAGLAFPAGALSFNPTTITAPNGRLQSYFPIWGGAVAGASVCYDWNSAAPCAGVPNPQTHPGVNGGATRDYGYAYDSTTQCLIGLGDAGVLFSQDPTTGGSPCVHSGAKVALNPSAFYCDGGAGHVRGYQKAQLENINLADVNLGASTAVVSDSGGAQIATLGFAADGSVDLSGISVTAHPDITVDAHLVLLNGNDFTGGNHPDMVVSFVGDAPQVCFRTTVAAACTVTSLADTATGVDSTGSFSSNAVSLRVAPGPNCQPKVSVNKEICAAHSDHLADCGPGGVGPWVKQTPLGVLYVHAFWRITVGNAGPVGITQATVVDPAEPSCASAAGTFDLAAGASTQFYCGSSIAVLDKPFTNTASVSYLPMNSPDGTPPSTAGPSSATACQFVCAS